MKRTLLCLLVLLAGAPAHAAPVAVPLQADADVPPATAAAATVVLFQNERFSFTETERYRTVSMPDVDADRIVLTVTGVPSSGEPWDRRLGISVGGVEVLRAITPRTTFTVRRDLTRYAAVMPAGADVVAGIESGSWVGGQWWEYTVTLDLYVDEPTAAAVEAAADAVVGTHRWAHTSCSGDAATRTVTFGATAPSSATLEITISGHGQSGEFWYINDGRRPRIFHVLVDGVEVGTAVALPYVYALAGVEGGNDDVHLLVWWSAFHAMDVAGVHTGVGEIPPYRATVEAQHLASLTGTRTVSIVQENGALPSGNPPRCRSDANWVISAAFVTSD